ncbi:MAG: tRNA threonylcarbamoyladenosine dehydratase [Clostridiales bacterium]|nr:tRNA threonylcarbamoyladenosine dehydratase [Clostridiales bacterium]
MREYAFDRTQRLLGKDGMEHLKKSHVAVFGIGGVGGYAVEALARSGIGALTLVDNDRVEPSNLNRQIIALHSTLGESKVDAAAARVADIAPNCHVSTYRCFFSEENVQTFDFSRYDFVIDAIDSIKSKILLIEKCIHTGTPIISCMGAGNKLDASAFRVCDLAKTKVCPLARVMRRELKLRGIFHLPVVYSEEPPITPTKNDTQNQTLQTMNQQQKQTDFPQKALAAESAKINDQDKTYFKRNPPGSVSFVPAAAGLLLGGTVVRALANPDFSLPGREAF